MGYRTPRKFAGRRYTRWTNEDKEILATVMKEQALARARYSNAITEAAIEMDRTPNGIRLQFRDYMYDKLLEENYK